MTEAAEITSEWALVCRRKSWFVGPASYFELSMPLLWFMLELDLAEF